MEESMNDLHPSTGTARRWSRDSGTEDAVRWPERRWWVCGMVFAATTIAYIDRQALAFVAPIVAGEYGLSNKQVARMLSAFLMSYTIGQPLAGRFFDWVGSRIGFAVSIGVWSLANMLTATVTGFRGFACCRLALGLGESGNYPGGVKVVGEWFPPEERSFAGGIFTSGGVSVPSSRVPWSRASRSIGDGGPPSS